MTGMITGERVEVCEVALLLEPDADGNYNTKAEDWDCGRVRVFVDLQEIKNPVGMAVISAASHPFTEVCVYQRMPDGSSVPTTFLADVFTIERRNDPRGDIK